MGLYINGTLGANKQAEIRRLAQTSNQWERVTEGIVAAHKPGADDKWAVVVLSNPGFDAAGVLYSIDERDRFVRALSRDTRVVNYYLATKNAIKALDSVCAREL